MPSFFESFLLGLLQGLAEFLPISSSGHLTLFQFFFSSDHKFLFIIVVHAGTLMSLILFYRRLFGQMLKTLFHPLGQNIFLKIGAACLPSALAGFAFRPWIKNFFQDPSSAAYGFLFTGVFLLGVYFPLRRHSDLPPENEKNISRLIDEVSYLKAFFIGCFQVLALFPGISRAGLCAGAGLYLGLRPLTALHFSFLMGSFALFGAGLLEAFHLPLEENLPQGPLLLSFISAFGFGCLALSIMKSWIFHLHKFSFYLLPLGLFLIIFRVLI